MKTLDGLSIGRLHMAALPHRLIQGQALARSDLDAKSFAGLFTRWR
jgi:hypothetical protein